MSNKIPRLSFQSTFLIPVSNELEAEYFVAHGRYNWFTQLFYDRDLGEDFQLLLEADFLYRINRGSRNERNFLRTPLSGFLSCFPNANSTIFVFGQHSNRYEVAENAVDRQFGVSQWFTQAGLRFKYQITSSLGLEMSYRNFIFSRNDEAEYNVNFGLSYIHR